MPLTIGTCPPERLKVVIADDCPAMRKGLAHLLADECDFALINSAATSAELRAVVARQPPHVLVMVLKRATEIGPGRGAGFPSYSEPSRRGSLRDAVSGMSRTGS